MGGSRGVAASGKPLQEGLIPGPTLVAGVGFSGAGLTEMPQGPLDFSPQSGLPGGCCRPCPRV